MSGRAATRGPSRAAVLLCAVALAGTGCSVRGTAGQPDAAELTVHLPVIPPPACTRVALDTAPHLMRSIPEYVRPVPDSVRQKADAFLASRLGEDFARDWMTYLPEESMEVSQSPVFAVWRSKVCYRFYVPSAPFVDMKAQVLLDEQGNCDEERSTRIPDCVAFPQDCEFAIDEKEAREIAARLGLPGGADAYSAQFGLRLFTGYVWHVCGVAAEPEDTEHRGLRSLPCLDIDARTGSRISYVTIDTTGQEADVFGHPIAPN
jgi:hypothetical protein